MNEVATRQDPMADFQQKLQQRVREDIRELLPADAVAALVQKAVEKEFFEPRRIPQRYGSDEIQPSWFVAEVVKAAQPVIAEAVKKCIADNPACVERAIAEFLDQNRLAVVATQHMTSMLSDVLYQVNQRLQQR